jgi:hypothetical protein
MTCGSHLSASSSSSSHPLSLISPSLPTAPLPSSLSLSSIWEARGLVRAGGRDATSPEGDGATGVTTTRTGGADKVQGRHFHGRRGVVSPDGAAPAVARDSVGTHSPMHGPPLPQQISVSVGGGPHRRAGGGWEARVQRWRPGGR